VDITAGDGPDDGAADLDLEDLAGDLLYVLAAFTEDVDMAKPIWLGGRKQKAALLRGADGDPSTTVRHRSRVSGRTLRRRLSDG
jgi:hypothetical protein